MSKSMIAQQAPTFPLQSLDLIVCRIEKELELDERILAYEKLQTYWNRIKSRNQCHRHEESHDE